MLCPPSLPHPRLFAEAPHGLVSPRAVELEPVKEVLLKQSASGEFLCNIPRTVTRHSPGGFAWGYRGLGAQELALNILNYLVPPGADGFEAVRCNEGFASRSAIQLYGLFTADVIAKIPEQGGTISVERVREWMTEKATLVTNFPRSELLPPFFSNTTKTRLERKARETNPPQLIPDYRRGRPYDISLHDELDYGAPIAHHKEALSSALQTHLGEMVRAARHEARSTEQMYRAFYEKLFALSRTLHGLDVELFRAETRGTPSHAEPLVMSLPESFQGPIRGILAFVAQKQTQLQAMLAEDKQSLLVQEIARGIQASDVKIQVCGPALLIACNSADAWEQLFRAQYANPSHAPSQVGAFAGFMRIHGSPELTICIPSYRMKEWAMDDFQELRFTIIHEREHTLQKILYFPIAGVAALAPGASLKEAEDIITTSFIEAFREEFLSFGLDGTWSKEQARILSPSPRSLYDFPQTWKGIHLADLQDHFPDTPDATLQRTYQSACDRYREWCREALPALEKLASSGSSSTNPGPTSVAVRALELLDTERWPEHAKRMASLGLLSFP
jgi:hypothetical protein